MPVHDVQVQDPRAPASSSRRISSARCGTVASQQRRPDQRDAGAALKPVPRPTFLGVPPLPIGKSPAAGRATKCNVQPADCLMQLDARELCRGQFPTAQFYQAARRPSALLLGERANVLWYMKLRRNSDPRLPAAPAGNARRRPSALAHLHSRRAQSAGVGMRHFSPSPFPLPPSFIAGRVPRIAAGPAATPGRKGGETARW